MLAASRAFDNESINSFQALQAPFLITDDNLAKAVATSDVGTRMLEDLTAVGGIMIIAIGLNLLNLTRIRVADWLPALPLAAVAAIVYDAIPQL